MLSSPCVCGHLDTARASRGKAQEQAQCGERHWVRHVPLGTETFYGTAEQVRLYMIERVAEHETAKAERPRYGKEAVKWRT